MYFFKSILSIFVFIEFLANNIIQIDFWILPANISHFFRQFLPGLLLTMGGVSN